MKRKGRSAPSHERGLARARRDGALYLMLLPTLLYFGVFRVWPMINMRLAFYDYRARGPWRFVGLKHFRMIAKSAAFAQILRNTLVISFMKYVLLFPFFVLFALLLNELRSERFRKYVQAVSYLPHFLSWVVIAGIWMSFLAPGGSGAFNQIRGLFGLGPADFLTDKRAIRWILFASEGWRSVGWDSIIFFTAILGIPPELYEAAALDGADRAGMIRHIILPALAAPMTTVFILNLGFFMSAGFDQVYNFSNPAVLSVVDILDTYINRVGIEGAQYSVGTAVSLIKGLAGTALVLLTHWASKRLTGEGVW